MTRAPRRDSVPEGSAIIYCQGAFGNTNGKTAHGLIRRSERYRVLSVVDARHAGADAGSVLDGREMGIPVVADVAEAMVTARASGRVATHLVVGLAPDGGRLPVSARTDLLGGVRDGLHLVSGLHDFLSEDPEFRRLARRTGVTIHDVRKPPERRDLHFFTGKIETVTASRIAVLGTDSAVGKRTTAWILVDALRAAGHNAELVGTGQTAWLQGARFSIVLDSLVNDFVAGEIEHVVWKAWSEGGADVVVVEGQGSLMNPAYPGGFEILAASRPHAVVLQHAPARTEYDGCPGHALHPLRAQIDAIQLVSARPVVAVTVNHEGLDEVEVTRACARIQAETGLPAFDALRDGASLLVDALSPHLPKARHEVQS